MSAGGRGRRPRLAPDFPRVVPPRPASGRFQVLPARGQNLRERPPGGGRPVGSDYCTRRSIKRPTFEVGPQTAREDGPSVRTEDALAFSPRHGLAAHRPLGGVNRARRATCDFSARYRGRFNRCPVAEPASLADLP